MREIVRAAFAAGLALVGLPREARAATKAVIVVYDGYGTPDAFSVSGRVLEDQGVRPAARGRSPWSNLKDNLKTLESDEIEGCPLAVQVGGVTYPAVTDDDGVFYVEARGLPRALEVGEAPVEVQVADTARCLAPAARAVVHVVPDEEGVAVVSDFDDTIVDTFVVDKKKMAREVLFKNAAQLSPVAGVGEAYRQARSAGARAFFYLSGSPQNFHPRIRSFLEMQGLPRGPLLLKNLGSDALFAQEDYKARRIRALLQRYPKLSFVLVGDTGERDPEIYAGIRAEFPARIAGILIRKTAGSNLDPSRFPGMIVVDDYTEPGRLVELVRGRAPAPAPAPAP